MQRRVTSSVQHLGNGIKKVELDKAMTKMSGGSDSLTSGPQSKECVFNGIISVEFVVEYGSVQEGHSVFHIMRILADSLC